jgi:hypothetical protein
MRSVKVGCDEAVKGTKARKAPQRKVAPMPGAGDDRQSWVS